jgi:uncharacterized repeat protein (TIGR03806 family)
VIVEVYRPRTLALAFAAGCGIALLVAGCGGDAPATQTADSAVGTSVAAATTTGSPSAVPIAFMPPEGNPPSLADWNQLEVRDGRLVTKDGVTPYALNSALFSDGAHKLRTVWLPDGAQASIGDIDETFDFPVGTIITKTFYYPVGAAEADVLLTDDDERGMTGSLPLADVRLVETRVLVHRADGWAAFPYVWNDDETEAQLARTGDVQALSAVDAEGAITELTYVVPNVNQCANCHATNHTSGDILPIGPKARHLNREVDFGNGPESQLGYWQQVGLLINSPPPEQLPAAAAYTDDAASLDERARAYLDINCAHCHNPAGAADTTGLFLDVTTTLGTQYGVCKSPVAAGKGSGGRLFDIVPGEPDQSIVVYRMSSTDPASMMPEIG